MNQPYLVEKIVNGEDFTQHPLEKGDYESCTFQNCDFSNSTLAGVIFLECEFKGCNLSLAELRQTAFRNVRFKDCKLLGLRFEQCNEFGFSVRFENCTLNHSSFYRIKLKKIIFKGTQLNEVDFTECDLAQSVFDNCDLTKATFDNTILEKADFRTSFNYSINPETNRVKKAKFSLNGVAGLLNKYDIEIEREY